MDIVDTHFHLWSSHGIRNPRGGMAAPYLQRSISWQDFESAAAPSGVTMAVLVQTQTGGDAPAELDFAERITAEHPTVVSFVGWAPLESAGVTPTLNRLAASPITGAVRRVTQHEVDPAFCATPDFVRGVHLAAERGLTVEVVVQEHQLEGVAALAAAAPEATIVLQHLGKPHLEAPPTDAWRGAMARIGEHPNVVMKASPTVYDASEPSLDAGIVNQYLDVVIDHFGWSRILFGTNWPVSSAIVEYRDWVTMFWQAIASATQADQEAVLAGNAFRVYSISAPRVAQFA